MFDNSRRPRRTPGDGRRRVVPPARLEQSVSSSPATQIQPVQPRDAAGNDAELVARIRAGDQAAFEALHAKHHDALWRFAYTQVRSAEAAEEIVQDVFLALWRKRAEWEVTSTVGGWLYGAMRHHALRHLRQERAVVRLTDRAAHAAGPATATADGAAPVAMGAPARDAHAALEEDELDAAVTRALAGLPERRRIAMTLRWKHQLAGPEIARVMGTTPEAVRVLLTRARQELGALLGHGRD
jgi:RNA polymerase sigma-70 factor (ECF subfamily)